MWLIVGLGNPGKKYQRTRHNIGFNLLDLWHSFPWVFKFEGLFVKKENLIYLKPQSYMNKSGEIIFKFASFWKIETQKIIVIYDDVALPLGKIRLKAKGSDGGHRGLRNTIAFLGQEVKRLRIGIGPKPLDKKLENFVLENLSLKESIIIQETFKKLENFPALLEEKTFEELQAIFNGN